MALPPGSSSPFLQYMMGTQYQVPDYNALIQQYLGPQQSLMDQQQAALSQRLAQMQQIAESNAAINAATLKQNYEEQRSGIRNRLGAQGLTDSGALPYQLLQARHAYERGESLQSNALKSYLLGLSGQRDDASSQEAQSLQQARLNLLGLLPQIYPATAGQGIGAGLHPGITPSGSSPFLGASWMPHPGAS